MRGILPVKEGWLFFILPLASQTDQLGGIPPDLIIKVQSGEIAAISQKLHAGSSSAAGPIFNACHEFAADASAAKLKVDHHIFHQGNDAAFDRGYQSLGGAHADHLSPHLGYLDAAML